LCKKLDVDYVEALELAVEPPLLKATFKSGQDSLPCRIRIGELVERTLSTDVLATKTNVGWVVSKGIKAEKAYSVSKLVIDVKGQEPGPKILESTISNGSNHCVDWLRPAWCGRGR